MLILVSHKLGSLTLRILGLILTIVALLTTAVSLYALNMYSSEGQSLSLHNDELGVSNRKQEPFPLSVFPAQKKIISNDSVELFLNDNLAIETNKETRTPWIRKMERKLSQSGLFQQFASPQSRVLVIWSGERKEEVIENISKILRWDKTDKDEFVSLMSEKSSMEEGTFLPGNYVVRTEAEPSEVANAIFERFNKEILDRYPENISTIVSVHDALTIASLLEREAYSFEHMRIISGVIWNRLFINMPLQIDATLQYVRGSNANEPWWPVPVPKDKSLVSPYNTYKNKGLPPGPISNPSIGAVVAALNPVATECLFYFHDDDGEMHCSKDYEQHTDSLKKIFGRGK